VRAFVLDDVEVPENSGYAVSDDGILPLLGDENVREERGGIELMLHLEIE
jgi:hypothetical protein